MFSHFITIWFLLSALSHKPSEGTVLYFDIYMKDSMVGTLRAAIDPMGPQTQYSSDTSVKVKVLKKLKVDYEYLVTYEDGYLFESNVDVLVNEKPHAEAYTKWTGTEYRIIKNGKKELSFNDKVPYSTILLFFREPDGIEHCYSEMDGSINTIIPLGGHSYKKVNSKGKENTYSYQDGKLKRASISGLVAFTIMARD